MLLCDDVISSPEFDVVSAALAVLLCSVMLREFSVMLIPNPEDVLLPVFPVRTESFRSCVVIPKLKRFVTPVLFARVMLRPTDSRIPSLALLVPFTEMRVLLALF